MQKDCQTVYRASELARQAAGRLTAAWYQREITVPAEWTGRRIVLHAEYVNSFATVFVDGQPVGEIRYPWGELDLTAVCRPGQRHVLSMLVVAMPLQGVMLSYGDTASARQVEGRGGPPRAVRRCLLVEHARRSADQRREGRSRPCASGRSASMRRWRTWPTTRRTCCKAGCRREGHGPGVHQRALPEEPVAGRTHHRHRTVAARETLGRAHASEHV